MIHFFNLSCFTCSPSLDFLHRVLCERLCWCYRWLAGRGEGSLCTWGSTLLTPPATSFVDSGCPFLCAHFCSSWWGRPSRMCHASVHCLKPTLLEVVEGMTAIISAPPLFFSVFNPRCQWWRWDPEWLLHVVLYVCQFLPRGLPWCVVIKNGNHFRWSHISNILLWTHL